ncbi:MAG: hypothetical protein JWM65_3459 [Sphingomonas bacterium]|nr:hypothetical protein [Sphingomonas bacterium]
MQGNRWAYGLAAVMALAATPAMAATTDPSPAELFQKLCVANNARTEAVEASARAAGFVPVANPAAMPEGTTRAVTLGRETATGRIALVATTGETQVTKRLPARVKAYTCGLMVPSDGWDARGYARTWLGIAPLFDLPGTVIYSYAQRPQGNVVADDDKDIAAFIAALNAGQLRVLVVAERGPVHGLSWVAFDAPDRPAAVPVAIAPPPPPAPFVPVSHDSDAYAPCTWKTRGKGSGAYQSLECPGTEGRYAERGFAPDTATKAQQGDTPAMLRMAYFYLAGPKAARDPAAGLAWARRAADAGSAQGAFDIGLIHDSGNGVAIDKAQAVTWYRKAADGGDNAAMIDLAALYLAGAGVPKDEALAASWVRKAADAGSVDAQLDMGWLSARGIGVPRDDAAALRWYRLASEQRDWSAKYRIGIIHADGIGVARNDGEAVRWLLDSSAQLLTFGAIINNLSFMMADQRMLADFATRANAGDTRAAMQLGLFLGDDKGGHYNPAAAMRLLKIAADGGIPLAMTRLGTMYAKGEGTARDEAEALRWLRAGGREHDGEVEGFRRIKRFFSAP